ncbi:MAG TPA: rhodanese-like domain-containing protein [Holophagaceae bacterium]
MLAMLLLMEPAEALSRWAQGHPHAPGSLFALICILLLLVVARPRLQSWARARHRPVLDPLQLEEMLLGPGALIVDLRDPAAFHQAHIRGSLNLTWAQLVERFMAPDPKARRAIVLVDETDAVAHRAFDLLQSRGYDWLYVLKGGMRAWQGSSRPIAKG